MKTKIVIFYLIVVVGVLGLTTCGGGQAGDGTSTAGAFIEEAMKPGLNRFHTDMGRYPTTEEGIWALLQAPKGSEPRWKGPYIEGGKIPLDPWGHQYQYCSPAVRSSVGYDLWSFGPDGVPNVDEIGNWSK